MSASSTPTERPFALRARARLAATVDLPTPPLPEATATIARTPGASAALLAAAAGAPCAWAPWPGAPRAGAWVRPPGGLAQRLKARAALGLDLDREADIAVADDDPRYHPERDDVRAPVGVAHCGQRVENFFLGNGHSLIPSDGLEVTAFR